MRSRMGSTFDAHVLMIPVYKKTGRWRVPYVLEHAGRIMIHTRVAVSPACQSLFA